MKVTKRSEIPKCRIVRSEPRRYGYTSSLIIKCKIVVNDKIELLCDDRSFIFTYDRQLFGNVFCSPKFFLVYIQRFWFESCSFLLLFFSKSFSYPPSVQDVHYRVLFVIEIAHLHARLRYRISRKIRVHPYRILNFENQKRNSARTSRKIVMPAVWFFWIEINKQPRFLYRKISPAVPRGNVKNRRGSAAR